MNKGVYSRRILIEAFADSIKKLNPRHVMGNPVMFVVEVTFFFALILSIGAWISDRALLVFDSEISILLLLTVWFSTFAEALSEGGVEHKQKASERRGKRCAPKK